MNTQTRSLRGIRQGLAVTGMLAGMLLGAGTVLAQAQTGDMPHRTMTPEMRQHMEERCKADPQKCEEIKKRIEEKHAACKADPEACKAKREEHRKAMQEKCAKDPVACEKKREEFRQKMEERSKAHPVKCEEWKKKHPDMPDGHRPPPPPPTAAQ